MDRTLRVKRIYTLGQYQNIELSDELVGIPEKLAVDDGFINLLSELQLLNLERRINKYYLLREQYGRLTPQEAVVLLEDEIAQTNAKIYDIIHAKKES